MDVTVNTDVAAAPAPPQSSTRRDRKAATRAALARAAIDRFATQGVEGTTAKQVAADVGVTERTFFHHFPCKEAAAFPDHDEHVALFRQALDARSERADPLEHLLGVAVVGARLKARSALRSTRLRLLEREPALRDHDARMDRDYEAVVAEHLEAAWGAAPEARLRARAAAATTIAVMQEALVAWAHDGVDPGAATEQLLRRTLAAGFAEPLVLAEPDAAPAPGPRPDPAQEHP